MMKMDNKKSKKGSVRVAAWVHAVINPLIEAIRMEKAFLKDRNWTWRYSSGNLEFIHTVQRYPDYVSLPNFEDFLRANPKFQKLFDRHDQLMEKLTEECRQAFQSLVTSPLFKEKVQRLLSEYMRGEGYPGGAVPEKDFAKLIAQYIINNIREFSEFYTVWKFWGRFGDDLLDFRAGEVIKMLDKTGEELEQYDEILVKKLEDLRFEFCQKYDIPAAPLPYTGYAGKV